MMKSSEDEEDTELFGRIRARSALEKKRKFAPQAANAGQRQSAGANPIRTSPQMFINNSLN